MQDLLEQVGSDELVEYAVLVDSGLRTFHPFLYPLAPLRFGDVHEFHTDGAAIEASRFAGEFAHDLQFGRRRFRQKAEWIEIGFQISPLAEGIEDTLPLSVGGIEKRCSFRSSPSSHHSSVLG